MNKSNREKLNLFFSSFLVIGFIVCTYFFMTLTDRLNTGAANLIKVCVFVLFGLVVFYATRVGEGIPVKRFSPIVLLVLVVPSLFIIIASLAPAFPLHDALAAVDEVMMFACIALGYGVPYTFFSGFEMIEAKEDELEPVQGGIAEELALLDEETAVEAAEDEASIEEVSDEEVATEEDVEELEALDGAEEDAQ